MSRPIIRMEEAGDAAGVDQVLRAAFPDDAEAKLVAELRADDDLILSLVANDGDGAVIGYAAFPRLLADDMPCAGLAPVAVAPEYQQRGIGSALITRGLLALKQRNEKLVFVLGEPAYYRRFGFDPILAAPFASDYAGPHFMALRLQSDAPAAGTVHYPPAFSRLA